MRSPGGGPIVLHGSRAVVADLDVQGSSLSALQATDGAEVRVVRGRFLGQGGAALYAGGARLTVEGGRAVRGDEYAIIGFREPTRHQRPQLSDYRVAGVAMVNSRGTIQRCEISRGGTEAGISITGRVREPVMVLDNRISNPAPWDCTSPSRR